MRLKNDVHKTHHFQSSEKKEEKADLRNQNVKMFKQTTGINFKQWFKVDLRDLFVSQLVHDSYIKYETEFSFARFIDAAD